jgi:hypothetical protein
LFYFTLLFLRFNKYFLINVFLGLNFQLSKFYRFQFSKTKVYKLLTKKAFIFKKYVFAVKKYINFSSRFITNYIKNRKKLFFYKNVKTLNDQQLNFILKKKTTSLLKFKKINRASKFFLKTNKLKKHNYKHDMLNKKKNFSILFKNRQLFKNVASLDKIKLHKLKKKFSNLKHFNVTKLFLKFELNILNVLVRCKFANSLKASKELLINNLVILNNSLVSTFAKTLKLGDRLQLVLTAHTYYFIKQAYFFFHKHLAKVKYKVWKLRFKMSKQKKKVFKLPTWVDIISNVKQNTPRYLELDYTVLCCTLVYYPSNSFEFNSKLKNSILYYLFRTYNWKLAS